MKLVHDASRGERPKALSFDIMATERRLKAAHWPPRGPVRLLIVLDRPTMVDLIRLTLNHGVYMTRTAAMAAAATGLLDE